MALGWGQPEGLSWGWRTPAPTPLPVLAQGLTERPQSQTTNAPVNNQSMTLNMRLRELGHSGRGGVVGAPPKGCKTGHGFWAQKGLSSNPDSASFWPWHHGRVIWPP